VGVYGIGALTFAVSLAFPGDLFDRYILAFIPFLILFVVRGAAGWGRIAWAYSLSALAVLAVWAILLKADQIDHDNARWQAGSWWAEQVGGAHVGFDWDNWTGRVSDAYEVADVPIDGWRIEARFPYLSRL